MERRSNIMSIYNLSPMQEGMLFHSLLNPKSYAYFEQFSCTVEGMLDVDILEKSFNVLIARHDVLRSNFVHEQTARPKQVVFSERKIRVRLEDLSQLEEAEQMLFIEQYREQDKQAGFNLMTDALLRLCVLRITAHRHKLIWSYHHILMDGGCLKTIIQELFETYRSLCSKEPLPERPAPPPYSEYIKWLDAQDRELAREFWSSYLSGYDSKAKLPMAKTAGGYKQVDRYFPVSEVLTERLELAAKDSQVTLNTLLQTTWGLLLARYNNTSDVVFGMVASGRPTEIEGFESMVGLFINTIPVRVSCHDHETFAELAKKVQQQSAEAKHHDYLPLAEIQSLSSPKHNLIDHLFGFQYFLANEESTDAGLSEELAITEEEDFEQSNYDFNVILMPGRGINVLFRYNEQVYNDAFIQQLGGHFLHLLEEIGQNAERPVDELELLLERDKNKLIFTFNDTRVEYDESVMVHQIIERSAAMMPDHPAVVFRDMQLTYKQLNERANQLARHLHEQGVRPGSIVAIMVEHSLEMMVGVLGILKAGGAYLPIDHEYPAERVRYMLQDSDAVLLLIRGELSQRVQPAVPVLELESLSIDSYDVSNLEPMNTSYDLAYVIYTSGSTGQPKGVAVEHRALVNMSLWHQNYYGLTRDDRSAKYLGFGFDASVSEIFPSLITGCTIYIVPQEIRLNVEELNAFYNRNGITISSFPTAITEQFLQLDNHSLTRLITGGDKLKTYRQTGYKLYNNYGPTENTVCSTSFLVEGEYANIPIGKPISNVSLYIVDELNRLAPIGVPGELCISGKSLARGYLNQPELTAAKFVPHPFMPGERMYRTGDLACWLPDGNVEFLGRLDQQVKIRGYRIELGEIEYRLLQQEAVKETVVTATDNPLGEPVLCAYVVLHSTGDVEAVKGRLRAELPDYMVPQRFVLLEEIPLTTNGKVDKQALPRLDFSGIEATEYVAPRNETEEQLALIWNQVLGVNQAGALSHFFELGGHSLNAIRLVSAVKKQFKYTLPLTEVFRTPVLCDMAKLISTTPEGGDSSRVGATSVDSIEPAPVMPYYPASSTQKRLYVLSQLGGQEAVYNTPTVLQLQGKVDMTRLEAAFAALIRRHESLRTSFEFKDGELVQVVHAEAEFHLSMLGTPEPGKLHDSLDRFVMPFQLSAAPLMRVGIARIADDEYVMIIDIHHMIADGTSVGVLVDEFNQLYNVQELPECRIHYKDYTMWQIRQEALGMQHQEQYWLRRFQGEVPLLDLPTDYARTNTRSYVGGNVILQLDSSLTARIRRLCSETGSTLYMLLLATCHTWLYKYSGQEDNVIGSPVAGRPHADLEQVIGMFVNTLAMRGNPSARRSFRAFLDEVKHDALSAFANQQYPFEDLVERLNIARDFGRNPIFDVILVVQNIDRAELTIDGLRITPYSYEARTAKFDLTITAIEEQDTITLDFEYATCLYKKSTVERFAEHFRELLLSITDNPDQTLGELNLLTAAERHKLITVFNDTQADYKRNSTIQQLFEEQVGRTPDQQAIVSEDESLTYQELNDKANTLAYVLRKKGIGPDEIVGIPGDRSIWMIVHILGVLKAGGAYLPLDLSYPAERISYMLANSRARFIVSRGNLIGQMEAWANAAGTSIELIASDKLPDDDQAVANLSVINSPYDLAYIIYTSGSTGLPKGVMIEHQGILNMQTFYRDTLGIEPSDRIVQFASMSFDASVWEMFMALLTGACMYLVPQATIGDYRLFESYMEQHQISVATLPPTYIIHLNADRMPALRLILTGGSEATKEIAQTWGDGRTYINAYGPTESTICATIWRKPVGEMLDGTHVPIGQPIENTQVYIVDGSNQLVPVGITGELCIAGDGLARGYLNNEQQTQDKFVSNPFLPGGRMYRTGDLARWRPDGMIEYIGRADHQVKIRGYRIETGEIESKLLEHERIAEALVLPRKDQNVDTYLCAYIVADKALAASELRSQLTSVLPDYMIPSFFIQLEEMPLTANGKPDRQALPEPGQEHRSTVEYTAPRNEHERKLSALWQEVLGVTPIGVYDNFFEIGGHSLKAASLSARINYTFGVEFPLRDLFRYSTLGEMGSRILALDKGRTRLIPAAAPAAYYPVSSAQKRMLILDRMEGVGHTYHIPAVLKLTGGVDVRRIEQVFRRLIHRHESFRTSFTFIDGEPMQMVHERVEFAIEQVELNQQLDHDRLELLLAPFDLGRAPLLRVSVVKTVDNEQLLVIDMHHIIADGMSIGILSQEFNKLYIGQELPKLKLQYKDYAVWQYDLLTSGALRKQEGYWTEQLQGEIPLLNMPTDYPRPTNQSFEGGHLSVVLDKDVLYATKKLASETGTTLYMVLLAAYYVLLSKYTGQEDIIVGSPVAGRPTGDMEAVIGMFVNTLAIRNQPTGNKPFRSFLDEVKDRTLEAFDNQDYQYEELLDKLKLKRDMSRNPLFDTMFEVQNLNVGDIELDDGVIMPYSLASHISKFDLTVTAIEQGEELEIQAEYAANLYTAASIERFLRRFETVIRAIVNDPGLDIQDIQMTTNEERHQIIHVFNDTSTSYPKDLPIHVLFEEQAAKNADRIAVVEFSRKLTYSELNEAASRVAQRLIQQGIHLGEVVGIVADRSIAMVAGMLGVLKAGGAYLPIDPDYPEDRIAYMLSDSKASIALIQPEYAQRAVDGTHLIILDSILLDTDGTPAAESAVTSASDLAYVMYTSGSTGRPKGVMIEHRSVVRLVRDTNYVTFSAGDKILQTGSPAFDATTFEIWGALLNGSELYIVPKLIILDPVKLEAAIHNYHITLMWLTCPLFNQLALRKPDMFRPLRYLIVGGDVLTPKIINQVRACCPDLQVVNGYGPTENTTFSCCFTIGEDYQDQIPIGRPISNSTAYIVDRLGGLCPIGIAGELWVGGDGVARSYMDNPELTADKFLLSPFVTGERLYRTGDMARWRLDGSIEYLGRIDNQVKIRGFRIEIGEIERCIAKHQAVSDIVIVARDNIDHHKSLCAYVVLNSVADSKQLLEYAAKSLPEYMIPSDIVIMDAFPLTSNGKVDKAKLPEPSVRVRTDDIYVAPRNETERVIVQIWSELLDLGASQIGVHSRFFEIGGHSLKAIQLINRLAEHGWELSINQVFVHQTPAGLAEACDQMERQVPSMVGDIRKAEALLQELLKRVIRYSQLSTYGTIQYVLQAERLDDALKRRIIDWFDQYADTFIHPHYIVEYTDTEWDEVIDEDAFYARMKASHSAAALDLELVRADIERMQLRFADSIQSGAIIAEFETSPSQEYHLMYKDISGTHITFDHYVNRKTLEEALLRTISSQDMMRSILHDDNGTLSWRLLEMPASIEIPFLDLTGYRMETRDEILKDIMHNFFMKAYKTNGSILYRVMLIQLNLREHLLLLPFSHAIFDFMSGEILKNTVVRLYESLSSRCNTELMPALTYRDYIRQIKQGPNAVTDEQLYRMFRLGEWLPMTQKMDEEAHRYNPSGYTAVSFQLPLDREEASGVDAELMWPMILGTCAQFFKLYFGITKLPVWLTNYGRTYAGNQYFATIGECIDYIPILVDTDLDIQTAVDDIRDKLQMVTEHNINFSNLIYNDQMEMSYPLSRTALKGSFEKFLLNINYLGELKEQSDTMSRVEIEGVNCEVNNRIVCMAWHQACTLHLTIVLPYEENKEKCQCLLEQAYEAACRFEFMIQSGV